MTRDEAMIHTLVKENDELKTEISRLRQVLEQEPILDKIRAEIESPNRGTCDYFIVDRIEEIINKYKAEMKSKEHEGH